MADINMDEFFSSGMMNDFFREMMEESGMAEDMMGDGATMEELQASFESFFKASMGMGDGPVIMPGGMAIDASEVPTMAELASLGFGGEDEDDMSPEELAAMMKMMGGCRGGGARGPARGEGCVAGGSGGSAWAARAQRPARRNPCQPASPHRRVRTRDAPQDWARCRCRVDVGRRTRRRGR